LAVQDSLGGNTKTYIIANVSPEAAHYGETLSTLNYVYRAKMIRNKAEINECAEASVEQLQAEIRRLQRELEMAAGRRTEGKGSVGRHAMVACRPSLASSDELNHHEAMQGSRFVGEPSIRWLVLMGTTGHRRNN
jgi:hypothetical protein